MSFFQDFEKLKLFEAQHVTFLSNLKVIFKVELRRKKMLYED
jgi:hypothetical protein